MTTKRVVRVAIIAALYVVLTLGIAPLSYGVIQFRVSEILKIFVLFDPWLALAIGIGTFFANMASPQVGPWELIFMPLTDMLGGLIAYALYRLLRRNWAVVPAFVYAVTTSLAVAAMLAIMGLGGFWLVLGSVLVSEAIILVVGVPIIFGIHNILKKRGIDFTA